MAATLNHYFIFAGNPGSQDIFHRGIAYSAPKTHDIWALGRDTRNLSSWRTISLERSRRGHKHKYKKCICFFPKLYELLGTAQWIIPFNSLLINLYPNFVPSQNIH